ncbi:MAG: hypothetical protein LUP91_06530, partial [Methylococcaceae bacterium]|nr:hypothetical protein [Methylococcaceae bacterium]
MLNKRLICHTDTVCNAVQTLQVKVDSQPQGDLHISFELTGDLAKIRIPAPLPPAAVDGLWERTCFEVFVAVEGEAGYHEFNFSPSGQWAAYAFSDYRVLSAWTVNQAPIVSFVQDSGHLLLQAVIAADDLPQNIADKSL